MVFKSGQPSANPKGRPLNSGSRQKLFAALIEPQKERLIEVALNLALGGNENLLRLLLEKLLPAKPIDDPLPHMPALEGTLTEQGKAVLSMITSGHLTPNEGLNLLRSITAQAKLVETDELNRRLTLLEEIHSEKHRKSRS